MSIEEENRRLRLSDELVQLGDSFDLEQKVLKKKFEKFLAQGANIDYKTPKGFTALTKAARQGLLGTVKVLLDLGANPNVEGGDLSGSSVQLFPLDIAGDAIVEGRNWGSEMWEALVQKGGTSTRYGSKPVYNPNSPEAQQYRREQEGVFNP